MVAPGLHVAFTGAVPGSDGGPVVFMWHSLGHSPGLMVAPGLRVAFTGAVPGSDGDPVGFVWHSLGQSPGLMVALWALCGIHWGSPRV